MREDGRCPPAAWTPPAWLLPHQPAAARMLASALGAFGVAVLADATGLGKTWTALAVATRYRRVAAVVPAILREQWRRTAERTGVALRVVSHEALSRGGTVPPADLVVVDEAHRFRNPATRRYDRLARAVGSARLLLVTATPVVNREDDLVALLRLGLGRIPRDLTPLLVTRSVTEAGVAGMPAVAHRHPDVGAVAPDLVAACRRLTFPSFGRVGRALLQRHLLYRLGSSFTAAAETLRRHDRYLEHLTRHRVTRADFRRLIAVDDPQMELPFDPVAAPAAAVAAERRRLARLLADLRTRRDPKVEALVAARGRWTGRTVVFTAAAATARAIARAFAWRRVVLVAGRQARTASGPLPVARALDCFAPRARGTHVAEALRAEVLVATDLVSEGLDLQDAHRVVHFDLPWTPQRLLQRLGRVARLGGMHRAVEVVWFPPPPALDLPARLTAKERTSERVLRTRQLSRAPDAAPAPGPVRALFGMIREAAAARDASRLAVFESALERVRHGLAVGAERELADLVRAGGADALGRWVQRWDRPA